jgi:hypothetical protein
MGNQTPSAGDPARSRSELFAALPAVRRLVDQLYQEIRPAVVTDCDAPEAKAIFQAVTAVQWLVDALDAPDRTARIERLTEVTNRADYVIHDAHQRLAELQSITELAADELNRRVTDYDTTAIIDNARLDVCLPNSSRVAITVAVSADGRVTWQAPEMDLAPVGGPTHLAVTTALTQLGEALTTALPESAFEEQQ